MVCNWKICFNVETKQKLVEFWCIFCKISECVYRITHTNFRSRSQKPPNATLMCDVDTNWPVCQLWLVSPNCMHGSDQRWSRGHKARGQGEDTKKSKTKDSLSGDRPSRGHRQECSRPRPKTKNTAASVFKKKRSSKKFFRQSPIYRRSQNLWLGRPKPQMTCNDVIKNLPDGT